MKYSIALALSALMFLSIPVNAAEEPNKVAEFKGNCIRAKGKLVYENSQWICIAKVASESGLTSILLRLPSK